MEIYSRVKNKLGLIFSIILLIGIISALSPLEQIQEFASQGSTIINNFGFNEKGAAETGIIQFNDKKYEIGNIINELFNPEDVTAKNIKLSKEKDSTTLTFNQEDASVNIKDNSFTNILPEEKAGHPTYIKLDKNGDILEADLTASDNTVLSFDEKDYKLSKDQRIIYKNGVAEIIGGDSLEIKDKSSNEFTKIDDLGNSLKVKRDDLGNSVLNGNFKIAKNEVKGEATLHNGKISKIGKDTKATIDGITQQTSEGDVNIYHDANFNALNHKGESYLNYGKDSISMGGKGFKIDLGNKNNVFGDMKNKKYIKGQKEPKKRDLKITLNNGEIKLEKNPDSSDLAFKVNGKGDYIIDNGRAIIYSNNLETSQKNKIFVKTNIKDGLTDSYDLTLNKGEYVLEDNLFKNSKGQTIVNAKAPWEDVVYKAKNINSKFINNIKEKTIKETGVRPRNYLNYMNEKDEEDLLKWTYEAADRANQNIYGVKISPEEVYTLMMGEGGAATGEGYLYYDYKNKGHNTKVYGSRLGLDYIYSQKDKLEKGNFIPKGLLENLKKEDAPLNEHGQKMNTLIFDNPKQALTAFAAEMARRKYVFEKDFKEYFGEEEFKKLSKEEELYWVKRYFNTGEGAGKGELTGTEYAYNRDGKRIVVQGKGRKNLYKPWKGEEISHVRNAQFNALLTVSTYKFMKSLGLFNFP